MVLPESMTETAAVGERRLTDDGVQRVIADGREPGHISQARSQHVSALVQGRWNDSERLLSLRALGWGAGCYQTHHLPAIRRPPLYTSCRPVPLPPGNRNLCHDAGIMRI